MKTDTLEVPDYKQLTLKLVKENLSYLLGGLTVIAVATTLVLTSYQSEQEARNNSSNKQSNVIAPPEESKLELDLRDKGLDFISPTVVEDGQISAIQSGKVTYHQNKYVVQEGESLANIAEKVYGDSNAWVVIAEANNIANPDIVAPGTELVIPRR